MRQYNLLSGLKAPPPTFTSRVIGPGKKLPDMTDWKLTAWLMPHEKIRYELSTLSFLLEHPNFDASNPKKAKALFHWYYHIPYALIIAHHKTEDNICGKYFPSIFGAGGHIATQHVEIEASLNKMKDASMDMVRCAVSGDAAGANGAKGAMQSALTTLMDMFLPHLDYEEENTPAEFTKANMDLAGYMKMINAEIAPHDGKLIMAEFGAYTGMTLVFPLILVAWFATMEAWGGSEKCDEVYKSLDPPLKLMWNCCCRKAALKHWIKPIDVIVSG